MSNNDDPAVPDNVARLGNAIFGLFAKAKAAHSDGSAALVHVLLTSAVEVAKTEAEAVEHADRIADELRANVRGYWKRNQDGKLITRLQ